MDKKISHLAEVNETYTEHMKFALLLGLQMIWGGLAALCHALFPNLLTTKASDMMTKLLSDINKRKQKTIKTE